MIDINQKITANGKEWPVRMDLNAMRWAQNKFGRVSTWLEKLAVSSNYDGLSDGDYSNLEKFNLGYKADKRGMIQLLKDAKEIKGRRFELSKPEDVYEAIQTMLKAKNIPEPEEPEIDLGVLIESFTEMINEGIDYENYLNGTNEPHITEKICGYILTDFGIQEAAGTLRSVITNSLGGADENEKN